MGGRVRTPRGPVHDETGGKGNGVAEMSPDRGGAGSERLSVNVSSSAMTALRELSLRKGTSVTEMVRRAIGLLKLVEEAELHGQEVQVYDPKTDKVRTVQFI